MTQENTANLVAETIPNVDYYAVLNVSKTASVEEIRSSYKRLAVTYHPDRQEPNLRDEAKEKFTLIKAAYETLADDRLRLIYDKYGVQGLKTGWELATKYKTSDEILAEFEKIQQQTERAKIDARVGSRSQVTMSMSAADLRDAVTGKLNFMEVTGMGLSQTIKIPFSERDIATLVGTVKTANGNGFGSLTAQYRKAFSNNSYGWTELTTAGRAHYAQVGAWRRLTRSTTAQISSIYHSQGGLNITTALERQLSRTAVGVLSATVGFDSNVTFGLANQTEAGTIEGNVRLEEDEATVSLVFTKLLSKRTTFKFTAKYAVFDKTPEIVVGLTRTLSKLSKGSMSLNWQQEALTLNLSYQRATHKFLFPVLLFREPSLNATLLTAFGFVLAAVLLKYTVLDPIKRKKKKKKLEKLKRESAAQIAIAKQHAQSAVQLMMATIQRKIQQEESKKGLIIVYARYGNLEKEKERETKASAESTNQPQEEEPPVVDVTVPLQNLVEDSKLILHPGSKASLMGFYDPCVGEEKQLYIQYLFKDKLHEVTLDDEDAIGLPLASHLVKSS